MADVNRQEISTMMKNGIVPRSQFTQTRNKEQSFPALVLKLFFFPLFPSVDWNCGDITRSKGESGSAFATMASMADIFLPHLVSCASWNRKGFFDPIEEPILFLPAYASFLKWLIKGLPQGSQMFSKQMVFSLWKQSILSPMVTPMHDEAQFTLAYRSLQSPI